MSPAAFIAGQLAAKYRSCVLMPYDTRAMANF